MPLITCPHCQGRNVSRTHRHFWDRLVSVLFRIYPFICDDCQSTFRAHYVPPPPGYLD